MSDNDDLDKFGLGGDRKSPTTPDHIEGTRKRSRDLPPGPWDNEPDSYNWKSLTGYVCRIERNDFGALCGYVLIDKGHPWYGKDTDDIFVTVHGGCTYSGTDTNGGWMVGFDCGHAGDLSPKLPVIVPNAVYRDMKYVIAECEKLAQQAVDAMKRKP